MLATNGKDAEGHRSWIINDSVPVWWGPVISKYISLLNLIWNRQQVCKQRRQQHVSRMDVYWKQEVQVLSRIGSFSSAISLLAIRPFFWVSYNKRGFGVAFLSRLSLSYCTLQDNNKFLCCCNNSHLRYIIKFFESETSLTFLIFTYHRNLFLE